MLRSKGDKDDEQKKRWRTNQRKKRWWQSISRNSNRLRQLLEDLEVDKWDPEQEKEARKKLSLAKKGISEETKKKLREDKNNRKKRNRETRKKNRAALWQLLED